MEEEYVVGPDGRGSWRPVKKDEQAQQQAAEKKKPLVEEDEEDLEGMLEDELME